MTDKRYQARFKILRTTYLTVWLESQRYAGEVAPGRTLGGGVRVMSSSFQVRAYCDPYDLPIKKFIDESQEYVRFGA